MVTTFSFFMVFIMIYKGPQSKQPTPGTENFFHGLMQHVQSYEAGKAKMWRSHHKLVLAIE